MTGTPRYWFAAKRYGWGWGLPSTWEGWVVMLIFFVLVALDIMMFPPRHAMVLFIAGIVVLSALLTAVAWVTGEPPRWRR